jgi:hypothetical protein
MDGVIIPPHILFDREQTSLSESGSEPNTLRIEIIVVC